ncbi:MAG: GDP-mannose 4,6-dehydratase [Coriobacteriia bacterium]|nr:GDP-mannose 4,6-dehydratase [Coriobacteriia bacterium]
MTKTAFITGAAGFIGSTLADTLLERGWRVIGIDSFEDYYPRFFKNRNVVQAQGNPGYTLHEISLLDLEGGADNELIRRELARADVVFHLAAQAGVRASWGSEFRTYTENNVNATQLLLEACREAELQRVVYASSSSVYGNTLDLPMREESRCQPFSPYGVTKLAAEHLCHLYWENFGLPAVSVRFFTVFGPRQRPDMGFHRFIKAGLEGRPIGVYGDGTQTRDFTFVGDIVEGLIAAGESKSGTLFNLAGGHRVTLLETLGVIGEELGSPLELKFTGSQSGDVADTWGSLDRAREELGYEPMVQLREGVASEIAWMREMMADPAYAAATSG